MPAAARKPRRSLSPGYAANMAGVEEGANAEDKARLDGIGTARLSTPEASQHFS